MRCENTVDDLGAYFLQARRVPVRCKREAKWIVSVNPPTPERTGKVHLCDHCNQFDYISFKRERLEATP